MLISFEPIVQVKFQRQQRKTLDVGCLHMLIRVQGSFDMTLDSSIEPSTHLETMCLGNVVKRTVDC